MWIALSGLAMFLVGLALLLFPGRIREVLFPRWREQIRRSRVTGLSLTVLRLVGAAALLASALSIAAFMNNL